MKVPIDQIRIKGRYRKDLGDLGALVSSMQAVGLLQPVLLDSNNMLIAGQRRIEAAKLLGWTEIEVVVAGDLDDALRLLIAQRDENTCRKDFAPSEAVAIGGALEAMESKAAKGRQGRPGKARCGKLPQHRKGKTRERVAAAVGMKARTYEKAKAVVRAAQEDPKRFGPFVKEMDATGKVDRAFRTLKRAQTAARIAELKLPVESVSGKFGLLYADPPWRYDYSPTDSRQVENQYPTMALEDIQRLPVAGLCEEDAVLFLWATSPKLPEALSVMQAWGFAYRTCMVWVKDKIGMGYYARQKHELLLIGTRGNPGAPEPSDRPASVICAKRGGHSTKPAEFYEALESMYPLLAKVELFARAARRGWTPWGAEAKHA